MPMTSVRSDMCVIMSFGEVTAIPSTDEPLCDTTELVLYRLSIAGLNIFTSCLAKVALLALESILPTFQKTYFRR